jgi:hypothetical protein
MDLGIPSTLGPLRCGTQLHEIIMWSFTTLFKTDHSTYRNAIVVFLYISRLISADIGKAMIHVREDETISLRSVLLISLGMLE